MIRFYDVESYVNLFCVGFLDDNNHLDMFYICEQHEEVKRACEDSGLDYSLYDLKKDASKLMKFMECPVPSKGDEQTLLSSFLNTTEKKVQAKEDYYIGFNTIRYDIPMLQYALDSVVGNQMRISSDALRIYSDKVIEDKVKVNIQNHLLYGNHVDAVFLNEKQVEDKKPKMGLKTCVGILGGAIIESESNKSGYSKDIYDDVLYNINDIVELKETTFPGIMKSTFNVRKALLDQFPHLREMGLTINDNSPRFAECIIAPNKAIEDSPVLSYNYPAPHIAKEFNAPIKDILEDTKDWYMTNVYNEVVKHNPKAAKVHLAKFMNVYSFYKSLRGKNWNTSSTHILKHGIEAQGYDKRLELIRTFGTYLPFIDKYGNESPTYANFSLGGIHGKEFNKQQLENDKAAIKYLREKYKYISKIPTKEVPKKFLNMIKKQSRTSYKGYPVRLSHEIPHFFNNTEEVDEILHEDDYSPYMVQAAKVSKSVDNNENIVMQVPRRSEQIIDRYLYTSSCFAVHQDFDGYYPKLIINCGIFYDGNGKDPYREIYEYRVNTLKPELKKLKEHYVKLLDDPNVSEEEKLRVALEIENKDYNQEGYKLVANSASGKAESSHDNNIRANNKTLAMRIIGQLFTWRIGMALALEGADIPSSNTDGIYASNISIEKNKEIVKRELAKLYVDITPEEMMFISKDSNNRMEIVEGRVASAKGGTLNAWKGANIANSLSHPAIIDVILTKYLQRIDLDKPVDNTIIKDCLLEFQKETTKKDFVHRTAWIMRSTSGSIFVDSYDNVHKGTLRTWLSKDGVSLTRYGTRSVQKGETTERYASELFDTAKFGDPEVVHYLASINAFENTMPKAITTKEYKESKTKSVYTVSEMKVTNLEENMRLHIDNRAIKDMNEQEIDKIYSNIELDDYVSMIGVFAKTWHNTIEPSINSLS